MPGVTDMGMMWMGANQTPSDMSVGLLQNESNDMVLDNDSPYYTSSLHSTSNQSLDDIQNLHSSPMVRNINTKIEISSEKSVR